MLCVVLTLRLYAAVLSATILLGVRLSYLGAVPPFLFLSVPSIAEDYPLPLSPSPAITLTQTCIPCAPVYPDVSLA